MSNPDHTSHQTPPGWYDSGTVGEERWWDGNAWTAYARPAQAVSTGQPAAQAHHVPGSRTPNTFWRGSKTGSLIAAIICAILIPPALISTLLVLFAGPVVVAPAGALVAFVACGVLFLLNFLGLRRNEEILREQTAARPDATGI